MVLLATLALAKRGYALLSWHPLVAVDVSMMTPGKTPRTVWL